MSYFLKFHILFIIFFQLSPVKSDIVSGKCPQVNGNKFNCQEIINSFISDDDSNNNQKKFLINGFLSLATKTLNFFANFFELLSITNYKIVIQCENRTTIQLVCDYLPPGKSYEPYFTIKNVKNSETKLELSPKPAALTNQTCAPLTLQDFEYVSFTNPGKYFALWGCHQINESYYDRGLIVVGEQQKNFIKGDMNKIIKEALDDMNLENETEILDHIRVNHNQAFETPCPNDIFHDNGGIKIKYSSDQSTSTKIIPLIVCLCIIFIMTFIAISVFFYLQEN